MNVMTIMGLLTGLTLTFLPTAWAQPPGADCAFYNDVGIVTPYHKNGFAPELMIVATRTDALHFVKGGFVMNGSSNLEGCPSSEVKCTRSAYLTAGDPVVVTSIAGEYSCVTYTAGTRNFPMTTGFLPTAQLVAAPPEAVSPDWSGDWKLSYDRIIRIKPMADGTLQVALQSYFPDIPSDGTEAPFVTTAIKPDGNMMAFSVDETATMPAKAGPIDSNPGNDLMCRVQLWRLGPYLVEADNGCGLGNNGTGAGVYQNAANHS